MRVACLLVVPIAVAAGCSFQGAVASDATGAGGSDALVVHDAPPPLDAAHDAHVTSPDAAVVCSSSLACLGTVSTYICNGKCWAACSATTSEPAASLACGVWGGKLAPLQTADDEACVGTTIFPAQASWTGFEQAFLSSTPSSGWSWNSDGVTPTYLDWAAGQPDDGDGVENGTEQCAYMSTYGTWQDTPCSPTSLGSTTSSYKFACRAN